MATPTFIQQAEGSWATSAAAVTTPAFTSLLGDLLVAMAGAYSNVAQTLTDSSSLTWTLAQDLSVGGEARNTGWTTALASDQTGLTVTATVSDGFVHGINTMTFSDSDGVGASAKGSGFGSAPSLDITTTGTNSTLVVLVIDHSAQDGTGRAWRTVGGAAPVELTYYFSAAAYTLYLAYHLDAGPPSTACTVGLTAPASQSWSAVVVEVQGIADPPPAADETILTYTRAS